MTEASDPPLWRRRGSRSGCALHRYGVFQDSSTHSPEAVTTTHFDPLRVVETVAVLGAAAIVFFTVGRTWLAPHETRLRDADTAYIAAGRGFIGFADGMQEGFRAIYAGASGAAATVVRFGRIGMHVEDQDVNWNVAAFVVVVVAVRALLLAGVGV